MPNSSGGATRQFIKLPGSRRRRLGFLAVYLAFLSVLLWGGYRLYWNLEFGVPIAAPIEVWDIYFPEIRKSGVLTAEIQSNDGHFDVLMLGASTIEKGWGNVEELLLSELKEELDQPIRIFNLATIAHTSRDSEIKASRLSEIPFDLILVYDGINDCRMNNCPTEMFRDDYSHCGRYFSFEKRRRAGPPLLPVNMQDSLMDFIHLGTPDPNLLEFGSILKTPAPFRQNLQSIVQVAQQHQSLLVLNTFAVHIPDGYTDEKLKNGELDFGTRERSNRCPLEMWGRKPDVIRCVQAHNAAIEQISNQGDSHILLVDQAKLLSNDGLNFVDACHFTDQGCRRFVDNLMTVLSPALRQRTTPNLTTTP